MTDSFVFYRSWYDVIKALPPEECQALVVAICEDALNDRQSTELTGTASLLYTIIKPTIKTNRIKRIAGAKGGRKKETIGLNKKEPMVTEKETIGKPMVSESENHCSPFALHGTGTGNGNGDGTGTGNGNGDGTGREREGANAPTRARMEKPSLDDLKNYALEKNWKPINWERFLAYYNSNGWKVGKNPMKSWKGAAYNWYTKEIEFAPADTKKNEADLSNVQF